ncbi:MAG: decarboxylase, partial [Thermodesulfovibrionia bacterium]|nr:decarboxylase [Thermodesulfovibrionia bacterium]
GRFIAASPVKLETRIVSIHENNIIVNASIYNSDLDALIVPVKLLVGNELKKGEGKPYAIKGITPCSMDLFRYRVYLKNPKIGDKIIFLNAGAYNFSSDFCDLEEVETEVVE